MANLSDTSGASARHDTVLAAALAQHAKGGTDALAAAESLFRTLWPAFRCRFERWGLPDGEAQDVASEALLRILDKLDGLRDPVAFEKWSNTVARNVFHDHLRERKRAAENEIQTDDEGWDSIWTSVEDLSQLDLSDRLCLQRQLQAFGEDHKDRARLLEHIVLEGWGVQELAAELQRTEAAAKEYLSQCRKRLMTYLQLCFEGEHV